jgi:hypothetical protein
LLKRDRSSEGMPSLYDERQYAFPYKYKEYDLNKTTERLAKLQINMYILVPTNMLVISLCVQTSSERQPEMK